MRKVCSDSGFQVSTITAPVKKVLINLALVPRADASLMEKRPRENKPPHWDSLQPVSPHTLKDLLLQLAMDGMIKLHPEQGDPRAIYYTLTEIGMFYLFIHCKEFVREHFLTIAQNYCDYATWFSLGINVRSLNSMLKLVNCILDGLKISGDHVYVYDKKILSPQLQFLFLATVEWLYAKPEPEAIEILGGQQEGQKLYEELNVIYKNSGGTEELKRYISRKILKD